VSRLHYRYGNLAGYNIGTRMMCLDYITGTVILLVTIYWYWDDVSRLHYRYGNFAGYHIGIGMMWNDGMMRVCSVNR
jgi:hypothetical protein